MNVQILIPDCLENPMGGMGEQARNLLNAYKEIYSDTHFIVIGSNSQNKTKHDNISFFPVDELTTYHGNPDTFSTTFLNQSLYVKESLLLDKPDIIHAFDWSTFFASRLLAKFYNIPLIVTIQLSIANMIKQPHFTQISQHSLASSIELSGLIEANRIIQVSESYAKSFPSFFSDKTFIIHNGINLKEWSPKNKIELPGTAKIKLIYIGRFAEMKNIETLLSCNIPKEIDLIFIGSSRGGNPSLFQLMQDEVIKRDNLHFVGAKYGQDKIDYLCSADAVIVPSNHEPFGIVALESLASNSILLSSFVNGMGDFLNEQSAINCGTSKESIENSFTKLLSMSVKEKETMKANGKVICKNHDWKLQAQKLANVYNAVLN